MPGLVAPAPADTPMRSWCAIIQFPGKKPVLYGTAYIRHGAPVHEVEAALRVSISACLPDGWSFANMIPGAVFFVSEEEGGVS